ncbi:MAG: hypothetical protein K2P93_05940 [Alphaproteobacteria bacterium]|nr:hypothetical protein [Alphaproteobacteria bacterium]
MVFLKSMPALMITIILLFSSEVFAAKRFRQEQDPTKVTITRLKHAHKGDSSKRKRNVKAPNGKAKKSDYKRKRNKNSLIPNRKKDKNIAPKKISIAHKRSKTNKKKKMTTKLKSVAHNRQKDKDTTPKKNVITYKKSKENKKKKAKRSAKPLIPNTQATNNSSNFDNHVWRMKDLGNGYIELTHRVDREMIIFGKRISTKIPGTPTVFTLPKQLAYAELERQQVEARKEPRSTPVIIHKKKRTLKNILLGD